MENLVPLGTGNSRLMKSNIPSNTTLAQIIQMWNNGTFPYDIGPLNSAGISQQGTPLNKDTLLKDETAALYGLTNLAVPDTVFNVLKNSVLYYPVATPKYQEVTVNLSTVQEGDILQLKENNKLTEFYVAKINYEQSLNGAGRVLLVRKDCYNEQEWNGSRNNKYDISDIDEWLNGTYKNTLDVNVQASLSTTKFPYTIGGTDFDVSTLERAVFLLSLTELGKSDSDTNVEGTALPIASTLQIAHLDGEANSQWTRSPWTPNAYYVVLLDRNGNVDQAYCNTTEGVRPAFTLSSTFSITYYIDNNGGFHDEQEYETANSTTDVQGNPITIGPQIATGSYVGTGTYGASNPNTLTFDFAPEMVVIYSMADANKRLLNIGGTGVHAIPTANLTTSYQAGRGFYYDTTPSSGYTRKAEDGKTIQWYATGPAIQFNTTSYTYYYTAIG